MKNDEAKFLATAKEWTKKYVLYSLVSGGRTYDFDRLC